MTVLQSAIRNPQSAIPKIIQRVFSQYQRQLVARTVVTAGLGFACLAALLWRLSHAGLGRWELGGIGGAGVAALVLWQWLLVRRDRLIRPRAILQLDRALGLHARLLTAVEFADVADPPPLYPRLVEEIAQTLPASLQHAPRVTSRWTFALAVALLLLLLWPRQAILPTQLAMRPPSVVQPPAPSPLPPQPPPPQDQRQSSKDQQRGNSGTQQDRSEGGQGSQGGQSHSSAGQSSRSGSADQSGGQGATQPSQADHGQGQSPEVRNQRNQANAGQAADTAKSPQSRGSQPQARDSMGRSASPASEQSAGSGQQEKAGESSSKSGSADAQGRAGTEQGAKQLAKLSQGTGAQLGSSAGQELLKADIQQLLKEFSAELKQLQAQLDADAKQHDQPSPAAGTSTDPQLYDAASQLEKAAGDRLPIQLDVDTQPTATKRRGSGVAEPSKEVADARPQQQPEDAALAEQGAAEQGVARQAIPPEYRPVFERLSHNR